MKKLIPLIIISFILVTCGDDDSETYNIAGKWAGPYDGEMGSGTMYMFMIQSGSDVTGTYSAPAGEDTGTVAGKVDGNEFKSKLTSLPYACDTYMKLSIQDSLHMSGYYRGYETCEDTGSVSLVRQ